MSSYFRLNYLSESESNYTNGIRTHLLRSTVPHVSHYSPKNPFF